MLNHGRRQSQLTTHKELCTCRQLEIDWAIRYAATQKDFRSDWRVQNQNEGTTHCPPHHIFELERTSFSKAHLWANGLRVGSVITHCYCDGAYFPGTKNMIARLLWDS